MKLKGGAISPPTPQPILHSLFPSFPPPRSRQPTSPRHCTFVLKILKDPRLTLHVPKDPSQTPDIQVSSSTPSRPSPEFSHTHTGQAESNRPLNHNHTTPKTNGELYPRTARPPIQAQSSSRSPIGAPSSQHPVHTPHPQTQVQSITRRGPNDNKIHSGTDEHRSSRKSPLPDSVEITHLPQPRCTTPLSLVPVPSRILIYRRSALYDV